MSEKTTKAKKGKPLVKTISEAIDPTKQLELKAAFATCPKIIQEYIGSLERNRVTILKERDALSDTLDVLISKLRK